MQNEKAVDTRPLVKVIASAAGWDGARIREAGDTFLVPASVFDKRKRFVIGADNVTRPDGFYDPPSWFEPAVEEQVTETRTVSKREADLKSADNIG